MKDLTKEHYRRGALGYNAYCKQTGGKSLVTGDVLPSFAALRSEIKDAWVAVAIALASDADRPTAQCPCGCNYPDGWKEPKQ